MASDHVKDLNKALRSTKTPGQVYKAYSKRADDHYAKLGVIALVSILEKYGEETVAIRSRDKWFSVRNSKGHRVDKMEKKTARALIELLDVYSNKLLDKLP